MTMTCVNRIARSRGWLVAGLLAAWAGCGGYDDVNVGSNRDGLSFEEFVETVYREPWEGGLWIVNGDEPIEDMEQLRDFYLKLSSQGALIINEVNGSDDRWTDSEKLDLTYCISNDFGSRKSQVVTALAAASDNWEWAVNVDFRYVSSQDGACNSGNNNVTFDVRPVAAASYLARAFFPSYGRAARSLLIDDDAFSHDWGLTGILTHELGHTLGMRHEHTRPEAGTCFENNDWRALTPYDASSIMHYPQCNGRRDYLAMTTQDRDGAIPVYGLPVRAKYPTFRSEYLGCNNTTRQAVYDLRWEPGNRAAVTSYDIDRLSAGRWVSVSDGTRRSAVVQLSGLTYFRRRACNSSGCSSFKQSAISAPSCIGGGGGGLPSTSPR